MENCVVPNVNHSARILLVEDNESLREMMELVFENEGYHFKCVTVIGNIIQLIDQYKPQLIMLDYLLPKVNGGELCLQIKKHSDYANIPVILYSALSPERISIGDYGCDAFIEKPFDLNELLGIINSLLKKTDEV